MNNWRKHENKAVTEYWLAHYVEAESGIGLCSLCGNTGIIDTRHSAISPAGINSGRLNWCICPNGQAMRITTGQDSPASGYVKTAIEAAREKAFNVTWGPDHGRPAGYYVSIPNYDGGKVVRLEDVEKLIRERVK